MDYLCAKFGDCSFSRLGFVVRTDRQTDRIADSLRDPSLSIDSFRRQLKTFLFDNQTVCI